MLFLLEILCSHAHAGRSIPLAVLLTDVRGLGLASDLHSRRHCRYWMRPHPKQRRPSNGWCWMQLWPDFQLEPQSGSNVTIPILAEAIQLTKNQKSQRTPNSYPPWECHLPARLRKKGLLGLQWSLGRFRLQVGPNPPKHDSRQGIGKVLGVEVEV